MNKYLFILGLVGTALFTACSSGDELIAEKPIETPTDDQGSVTTLIAEESQNSEVPITLGIGQSRGLTRAPIESGSGNVFSTEGGKYLGVFCLATGYQSSYESSKPIANNWTADDETGLIVRMNNVPATVLNGNVTFKNSDASANQIYYYPMSNWMKYNFYAYYPWQDGNMEFKSNQVVECFYTLTGTEDIIWGKADPAAVIDEGDELPTDADPFGAKYYRWRKNNIPDGKTINDYLPKLTFEHKLAQLRFFVKAVDYAALKTLKGLSAQVTDMYISNGIQEVKLVVANKSANGDKVNGRLIMMEKTPSTTSFPIKAINTDNNRFGVDPVDINVSKVVDVESPATTFTAETAAAYNETLNASDGIKVAGNELSAEEAATYNAKLDGALQAGVALDATQVAAYNLAIDPDKSEGDELTTDEANAYNATLGGALTSGTALTAENAAAYNAKLPSVVAADDDTGLVGYIMLAPPSITNDNGFKYHLLVKLKTSDGSTNTVTIDLEPPVVPESDPEKKDFEAGKIYNIIVNVQSPEVISAKAVLQGWQTYKDDSLNPYIVYDTE